MTQQVKIGNVIIGGGNNIAIQTMCNTLTSDTEKTLEQIYECQINGCDIIRVAVLNQQDAEAIKIISDNIRIPIVADIHFDYKLAISAMENGADKVRVNPGNLGGDEKFCYVIDCAKANGCAIRIGANSGSVNKEELNQCGDKALAMVNSLRKYINLAENRGFYSLVLAAKSSDVKKTILMNRMLNKEFSYPLHIGVTEAGVYEGGIIKSAIGIGSLLSDNIGDTIRVSLTDNPVKEILAAKQILSALNMYKHVDVVSCPTCGRTRIDLIPIANAVNEHVKGIKKNCKIAVMGCAVNGPGEAMDADIGLAGGNNCALIFCKGKIIKRIEGDIIKEFLGYVDEYLKGLDD